ncbi:hypothetical protein JTE90_016136 [Oedothorax gibbosus]|uniref:G-protein coupled receptors family 3 profile domain-containing protein n=1 Tax=Oedothorax gibbosus TaxID=931172 RepID=A0AAV6U6N8_9ARAC|nr:hypothetical protein JTE90_016136 [Oedothorax gibbosus]
MLCNADGLSRIPLPSIPEPVPDPAEILMFEETHEYPMTAGDIATATQRDSILSKEFLRKNGVKMLFSPPYNRKSNGQAERTVQTVKQNLRRLGTSPVTYDVRTTDGLVQKRHVDRLISRTPDPMPDQTVISTEPILPQGELPQLPPVPAMTPEPPEHIPPNPIPFNFDDYTPGPELQEQPDPPNPSADTPTISNRRSTRIKTPPKYLKDYVVAFSWTYVSVVYSDTDYGNKGYEKLQELAPKEICFSSPQSVNVDHFSDADYDTVIQNLMHKTNARVVVVFSDRRVARNVMSAAHRRQAFDRFVWIGSEAWGGRQSVVEGLERVLEGAITISPLLRPLAGFDDHFTSLTPDNNAERNPWFPEFWEEHFYCKLQDFSVTPYNQNFHKWCQEMPDPKISESNGYRQMPALHFVRDSVYAFAHALHNVHRSLCAGEEGICERMRHMDGLMLKEALGKVHFKDESEKTFRFLPSGDAPPRYSIINFQKKSDSDEYFWRPVGTYAPETGLPHLVLDKNALRFKQLATEFPRSFCSAPCQMGQAKLQLEGDTCCWYCTNCSTYQYLPDEYRCEDCPLGTLPSPTKTTCEPIPEAYLSYSSPWAIGTMAFAGMGIVTTIAVAIEFYGYRDTPIIKASGRELSALLLLGIFLSFSMTFVIVAKPAPCTCGLTRFFLGFCYTLCYAAVVTKTSRIARIFSQRRCQRPRYTSPKSQLVITALLVSVEGVINTTWLLYDRPAVTHMYPSRTENVLICVGSDTASYLVGLIYPFVLIGFCTVYAFKTRKCPDGFNEARYLTFTNYTTCVIWLAFLPLFVLSTSNTIRSVTLSSLLSLSGAVQLACLFVPKVYVAVFKPEKNTKDAVMCPHNRNSSCLAVPQQNPAGPYHQAMPLPNLLNGDFKDNYRNSICSTGSTTDSKLQGKHNSDHNLCYSQQQQQDPSKNLCVSNMNLATTPSAPSCNHQANYPNIELHMTM